MHQEKQRAMKWGMPNLVHNVEKKMSKAILKYGMTRCTKSQTPKHGHAQDPSQA
jgi:hypothetical protein